MSVNNNGRRDIAPTHPGSMLREDFMPDFGLSASTLAATLGVSRQTINELLRERRALSPAMALRLSRFFGNSPEFWLNAQQAVDLWQAEKELAKELALIQTRRAA
jgi:antitoxin HigA-1